MERIGSVPVHDITDSYGSRTGTKLSCYSNNDWCKKVL
jgi:hypothetical protein